MSLMRRRFVAYDQRTGAKINSDRLVQDGHHGGLHVAAGTDDGVHPQRTMHVPTQRPRAMHGGGPYREREMGATTIHVGLAGEGALFARPGIDTTGYSATDVDLEVA